MDVGTAGRAAGLGWGGFLRLILVWVLNRVLWCRLPSAAFLEVEMAKRPQIVLLNDNAIIECKIPGSPHLNIQTMGVTWFRKSQENETDVKVFEIFGNHQEAFRVGAFVPLWRLERGDASLQLPGVQLKEAGQYRCEMVITPDKGQGTVRLQVVAYPVCNLFKDPVKDNEDRHILCKSSGFYPKDITITWNKWTQEDPESVEVSEGIITDPTIQNEDGTFNVTSHLRLKPSLEHSVTTYECVVRHITLPIWKSNLTLSWEKSEKSASSRIVGLFTALITGPLLILYCFL